ncbi:iron complex transport system ATP-binding protein [Butyrivibrio fibrisolvens DSM 3071]|uniref:Iron complex transport system ATP-binding protein n=1 Tax=Butyrivibrio fibrisolvens DSM 3071 TaxID=1121131 RepID=A0A1M5Z2T8_BUTFI|nr:ABC transporter ATP-binding protein [Butyrivibrio fibrisolvens]SHI18448.1 iron complex transport system ATP-binding protein [Butyrivibrio fibrisolvens DSM 3071]
MSDIAISHEFKAQGLWAGYDDKTIIKDMNISIPAGKFSVLIGPNGCGKSTLLKSFARLLKPGKGQILLDGKSIYEIPTIHLAKQVGLLPQTPIVPEGITVADLVARGRFPYQNIFGQLSKADYEAIACAMEAMGVSDLADKPVDSLSGGQRQRVWIALSLAQSTDILLLDEPTTYLDIAYQVEILDCLAKLNKLRKTTIVAILHDINLSIRYADHIFAMKKGELIAEGDPKDIITPSLMRTIYGMESAIISDPETGDPYVIPRSKAS